MTTLKADKLSRLHRGLGAIDALVGKAIGVDPMIQSARIEMQLRRYLEAEWDKLSNRAAKEAAKFIKQGKGPVTDAEIKKMMRVVDRTMSKWSKRVTSPFTDDMREIYKLNHVAAGERVFGIRKRPLDFSTRQATPVQKVQPPSIRPNFDLVDQKAMSQFQKHQTYWIGKHYKDNVSKTVARTAQEEIVARGRGRVAAGAVMERTVRESLKKVEVPGGFIGSNTRYFEGLAANAATTERVHAQMNVFHRSGVTKYTIVNPVDHRTCPTCRLLDGKEFFVKDGMALMNRLSGAKNPEAVRNIQPYLTPKTTRSLTGGVSGAKNPAKGTGKLAARGNAMPPYHYRCRCSVDITRDAELLDPKLIPPVVPKKPVAIRPKPKTGPIPVLPPREQLKNQMRMLTQFARTAERSGLPKDYAKVRGTTEQFVKKNWGISMYRKRNIGGARGKRLGFQKKKNAGGFHDWFGDVYMDPSYKKRISIGIARATAGEQAGSAAHTLIHEVIHGADRMVSGAYTGGGAVVTEVATELATRRILLDMAGETSQLAISWPGSYAKAIAGVRDTISDVTKWGGIRVRQEMERASMLVHTTNQRVQAQNAKQMVEQFVRKLPGAKELTAKQSRELVAKLEAQEAYWLKKKKRRRRRRT